MPVRELLHYATTSGSGSPLVLVHGGLANGQITFGRTARSLARWHKVVVVDRRGHGQSPKEPRPYTIEADAHDILAVAKAAGLGPFHLVGHSYGGVVALDVVRLAPERVLSLHLIEPPLLGLLPDEPEVKAMQQAGQALWQRAADLTHEEFAAVFLGMVAGEAAVRTAKEHWAWPVLVREAARMKDEQYVGTYEVGWLGTWQPRCAVRIYTGGHSHPALRRIAHHLADMLPDAVCVDIEAAGHEVHKAGHAFEKALLQVTRG